MKCLLLLALLCCPQVFAAEQSIADSSVEKNYVVVLGHQLSNDGSISGLLKSRLDAVLDILKFEPNTVAILSGKGGGSLVATEAEQMRNYLVEKGIPIESTLLEPVSMTTLENAWYARTLHIDPLGVQKFRVLTSASHIQRAKMIFDKIFGVNYVIEYVAVPDPYNEKWSADAAFFDKVMIECYPILFENLIDGDLKSWHQFFYGENTEKRKAYQQCKENLLRRSH